MRVGLLRRSNLLDCTRPKLNHAVPSGSPLRSTVRLRYINNTNYLRQHDRPKEQQIQSRLQLRPEQSESIKPESFQEPPKAKRDDGPKTDALLSEQTVSNKEQRKADWAIMKEMARYLWPKVGQAC